MKNNLNGLKSIRSAAEAEAAASASTRLVGTLRER